MDVLNRFACPCAVVMGKIWDLRKPLSSYYSIADVLGVSIRYLASYSNQKQVPSFHLSPPRLNIRTFKPLGPNQKRPSQGPAVLVASSENLIHLFHTAIARSFSSLECRTSRKKIELTLVVINETHRGIGDPLLGLSSAMSPELINPVCSLCTDTWYLPSEQLGPWVSRWYDARKRYG